MATTPLELVPAVSDLAKDLGLIDSIKQKLMKQPDAAADHLAAVMEELQKSFLAFENEVANYLAVTLEPGENRRADLAVLYSLEGQALWARVQTAHTRCRKIEAIYTAYLDPWFKRVTGLNATERKQLEDIFDKLGHIDGDLVGMLSPATWWLSQQAQATLDAYDSGNLEEASGIIASARRQILPTRRALATALGQMRQLEADFIEVAAVA